MKPEIERDWQKRRADYLYRALRFDDLLAEGLEHMLPPADARRLLRAMKIPYKPKVRRAGA